MVCPLQLHPQIHKTRLGLGTGRHQKRQFRLLYRTTGLANGSLEFPPALVVLQPPLQQTRGLVLGIVYLHGFQMPLLKEHHAAVDVRSMVVNDHAWRVARNWRRGRHL